jgi:O-antigen/teichoic acid export membrane protein
LQSRAQDIRILRPVTSPAAGGGAPVARARTEAATLFGGKVVANIGQVGLAVVTARGLGPSGRGSVVMVVTVMIVTTIVCSVGTSVVMRTRLAVNGARDLPIFLGLTTVMAAVQIVLTGACVLVIGWAADLPLSAADIGIAAALGGAGLVVWMLIDISVGLGRARSLAVADSTGSLSQLVLYVLFVQFVDPSIGAVLTAVLLGYLVEAGLLARVLPTRSLAADRAAWASLLRAGVPTMQQAIAEFAAYRFDRLLIGLMLTPAVVGVYSVAATGAELLRLLPLAVGQIVSPRVAGGTMQEIHLRSARWALLAAVGVAGVVLALVGPLLIAPVLGSDFADAGRFLPALAASEVMLAMYQFDTQVIQGLGRVRDAAMPSIICGPIVLVLDAALIPLLDAHGAALARLIGYGAMAIIAHRRLVHVRST